MIRKRIISAISGGVDSSVATALYIDKGYDVIGVTLRLNTKFKTLTDNEYSKEEERAKEVCKKLGIKHILVDCIERFNCSVLKYSFEEYKQGRTPNPCAYCNPNLKFAEMLKIAREYNAEGVITGHYTQKYIDKNGIHYIKRGKDTKKDQSYFLCMLSQDQLSKISFPLAELTKPEVRDLAAKYNLVTANVEESQDVCFVQKGENFQERLAEEFSLQHKPGNIVDKNGNILGKHDGIYKYTIGQRKGLNIAMGKPAFVTEINSEKNEIILSTEKDDLMSNALVASNFNWFNPKIKIDKEKTYFTQIRYRHKPVEANVEILENKHVQIKFKEPQRAVTTGQIAAIYEGDILLGGGWIEKIIK